jgi:hypothetical protein
VSAATGTTPCGVCGESIRPSERGTHTCRPIVPLDDLGSGYVFPTWEASLHEAFKAVDWAYERRKKTVLAAVEAGLTFATIGAAVGMSPAGVHKIARANSRRRTQEELLHSPHGTTTHAPVSGKAEGGTER